MNRIDEVLSSHGVLTRYKLQLHEQIDLLLLLRQSLKLAHEVCLELSRVVEKLLDSLHLLPYVAPEELKLLGDLEPHLGLDISTDA